MSISNSKELLIKATAEKYAVGAFNVTNIAQMAAVIETAAELKAPVIIQTSVAPVKQLTPELFAAAFRNIAERVDISVAIQLDHCTSIDLCKRCVDAGYTSIMIDASKETLKDNIRITKTVVDYARGNNDVSVEGELGTVGGVEDQVRVVMSEVELCDPKNALKFIEETGLDNFAPAIGTAHGIYKSNNPEIDIDRLKIIAKLINGEKVVAPLVIHGGSGLSEQIVRDLVFSGGSKFNVSTELKHVWIKGAEEYIISTPKEFNPVKMNRVQMDLTMKLVHSWIDRLGSSGKSGV